MRCAAAYKVYCAKPRAGRAYWGLNASGAGRPRGGGLKDGTARRISGDDEDISRYADLLGIEIITIAELSPAKAVIDNVEKATFALIQSSHLKI
jgi:hypothetical protein